MSTPAPLGMFIVGFIIFALYIWGLLTMIYRGHKQQREEFENDPEIKKYFRSLERKKRKRKKFQKVVNGKKEV